MRYAVKFGILSAATLALAGCSGSRDFGQFPDGKPAPRGTGAASGAAAVSDFPQKIGDPYKVGGKTYTPEDVQSYDEVGYASWYGEELAGNPTANGERFNPQGISAAHKTLPLPSYVEVTALDTGRTILVRVNDRGPFANDRLIDLSHGAAKQLGIDRDGVSGVRVRKVNPNEQERAVLRMGAPAAERIATPDSLLAILRKNLAKLPTPAAPVKQAAAPVPASPAKAPATAARPSSATGSRDGRFIIEGAGRPVGAEQSIGNNYVGDLVGAYVVQVAAFSDKARADTLAKKIGAKVMPDGTRSIWRVRYGPYASEKDAQAGLAQAQQRGYSGARILRADK
ncbi:septal ring lytic transglycosylase RlpA family protein [Sphingorhabdus sp. SMR4y]|uniref:septal ring lytic transglycosylase RlpA family protein n=1 Tax=Sphingorhabdus sp. SMR4y TaxID=2584094 RepID=UPI000B5CC084|nr:septal ring lytic transglycosylase RlpA family protein [Sphingorhabdus sp. SMR4y]ASK87564.1 RlpA-like protein [Sphingorhabdus sp. SMR4y]